MTGRKVRPRKIEFRLDDPAYQAAYAERFATPSLYWLRPPYEQETHVAYPRP